MRGIRVRSLVLFIVLSAGLLSAQTSSGSISGLVYDATGALIPGVRVTATNVDTGVAANLLSNESGAYNLVSLLPGTYRVTAELPGFRSAVYNKVELGTSAQIRLDIKLEVGGATETVEVKATSDTILLEAGASVGEVLTTARLQDLPLVGNNVLDLVRLLPGFRSDQVGALFDTMGGVSVSTVNTVRDGLSVSDGRNNNGIFSTTNINPDMVAEIRLILSPVDAELGRGSGQVQIQTKSGTNKYTGSVVWNARNSGLDANTWVRNRTIINGAAQKPDWRNSHEFTGSYGGPIRKNKTFFFVLYNHNTSNTRQSVTTSVMTDAARNGVFRYFDLWNNAAAGTPIPQFPVANLTAATYPVVDLAGNPARPPFNPDGTAYTGTLRCFSVFGTRTLDGATVTPGPAAANDKYCPGGTWVTNGANAFDPLRPSFDSTGYVQKILKLMPTANYFGGGDGLNQAQFIWVRGRKGSSGFGTAAAGTDPANTVRKQINVKIDENFSQKHRLSAGWTYEHDDSSDNVANWPGGINGETFRRPQILTANFTSTLSPTMLNEARFGIRYNRAETNPAFLSSDPSVRTAAEDFLMQGGKNANGKVYPVVVNLNSYGAGNNVLNPNVTYSGNKTPLFNYADTLSWTRANHSFKFGAELRLPRTNGYNTNPFPTATGGAATGSASVIATINNAILPNMLQTNRNNAANMLYFLAGSLSNVTQNYWVDTPSDITNGTWQDIATKVQRYRNQVSTEWSFFWKDDWKATRRLTLNLGIRYDYYSSPYIDSGFTATTAGQGAGLFGISKGPGALFDNFLSPAPVFLSGYGNSASVTAGNALLCSNTAVIQAGLPSYAAPNCDPKKLTTIEFVGPGSANPGKVAIPVDKNNWGPAIGFSWSVPWFGEGKTLMRGGYQVSYTNGASGQQDAVLGVGPGITNAASINLANFTSITSTRALNLTDLPALVPVVPTGQPGGKFPIYSRAINITAFDPNFRTPYVQNFTLSVTRNVMRNVTADIRYIGNFAKKQLATAPAPFNLNLPNVYHNQELLDALNITRAGGNAPLFDQLFAGLNLNPGVPGYAAVGSAASQTGSAHLRRLAATNLANGNYSSVANTILGLNVTTPAAFAGTPTEGASLNGGQKVIRNGCDRLANGQTTVGTAITTPLRCFPENFLIANPQFNTISYVTQTKYSNYHSMQAQISIRPTQGISFQSTYTWAKSLGNGDIGGAYLDPLDRKSDYTLLVSDVRHDFRTNGTFVLPIGPNKLLLGNSSGILARLLERWQTSIIYTANSGNPRTLMGAQMQYYYNGFLNPPPETTPDIVGPWVNPKGNVKWDGPNNNTGTYFGSPSQYIQVPDPQCTGGKVGNNASDPGAFNFQASCTLTGLAVRNPDGTPGTLLLQNPLPGKRGTLGMQSLTAPGRWSLDANIGKSFRIDESKTLTIRIDTTNVLNHPQFGTMDPGLCMQNSGFGVCGTEFGVVPGKGGPGRTFQGQVRMSF